jgi:membrane protease YdiL (CAAX protease family)
MVANAVKYGKFSFVPVVPVVGSSLVLVLILAFATAISEEILTRGFFYTRLKEAYGDQLKAMVVSTAMYFMLLVPFIFAVSQLKGVSLMIFVMTNLIISFANTMIFDETKTITVPVLIHAFWNMAVVLYL